MPAFRSGDIARRSERLGGELCGNGVTRTRVRFAVENAADPLAGCDRFSEVDASLDPEAVEQVQHVLSGHVSGRPFCIRTSTKAGDARVEARNAELEAGINVRCGHPVRVVKVAADLVQIVNGEHSVHYTFCVLGCACADRVGYTNVLDTDIFHSPGDMRDGFGCNVALIGATQCT